MDCFAAHSQADATAHPSTPPAAADPEKASGLKFQDTDETTTTTAATTHHAGHVHHHPHVAQARERLRHFLHPDGRKIHVAYSPEEAHKLRHQLKNVHGEPDEQFEILISGSKEHLEALRKAQAHHNLRREELRQEHPEHYGKFESVWVELDALSHELERVTTHGVSLEAHFSKYGYDAKIRSYDEEGSPAGSATPRSGRSASRSGASSTKDGKEGGSTKDSSAEIGYATPLKLWKTPVVRQYWHKGILWRASGSQEVQSFELFVDLLYVGILAIIGDSAAERPDGFSLLQFVITFMLSWKIWADLELTISWFETDDVAQRLSILFQLAVLFGLTTNITYAFDGTYATMIGFYLTARLLIASFFVLVAYLVPMVGPFMLLISSTTMIGVALWIASIHVSYPLRLALIFPALWVDIGYQGILGFATVMLRKISPKTKATIDRIIQFTPATNIEHRTERMNAFVALVFGYMVVSLLYQSTRNGIDKHFGKAVLGLTQAFCFNWLYFEVDGSNLQQHAIRRSALTTLVWNMAHLIFIMGFTLAAGALARLVFASDISDSGTASLSPKYAAMSESEISSGIRWFYCAGLGVALACMGLISLSHIHRSIESLRIYKKYRLAARFAVAIVLICLPLATSLNSLQLVGTVTGLIVFVLGLELWAASCSHECLFSRDKPCQYFGRCGKKDLERLVHEGDEHVDVDELLKKHSTHDGHDVSV